jgi:hypothetical protein
VDFREAAMADDAFEPKLGKPRSRGGKSAKRYAHQAAAAINRTGAPIVALTSRDRR